MHATKVLLRWYKSFNVRYHGYYLENESKPEPWELYEGQHFPFVEIPLNRQITTIVGANESGKSHLLSAMAKVFTGAGVGDDGNEYAVQDICRYCAFEGLEKDVWPSVGVELAFGSKEEAETILKSWGIESTGGEGNDEKESLSCTVIIDGGRGDKQFAQVFHSKSRSPLGYVSKNDWEKAEAGLPALEFIDAGVALSNEVHVNQLLAMYDGDEPQPVYDPIVLQELAESMLSLNLVSGKPVDATAAKTYTDACGELQSATFSVNTSGKLETLLFRDVLRIRKGSLQQIAELGGNNRGYVERLVAEINHRIDETLDLTHFWQQDDEFRLTVDYKSGFFFFEITDKTGAKYTFNERSSGLRYFLSYYVQAKAIEQENEARGSIVLMDEPDSFLSIAGQRNLLQVFESLVSPKTASGSCQLVYTTHSPFLINRNFPHRLCLVRKGDGGEGTQFVPRSSIRRYEPIRSALSVACTETLFMGSVNIVVEGISDQRILVSAIQRFGDPSDADALLNLNKVNFVSAGGASHVKRIVEKSTTGDERKPVVVVLLDGDNAGNKAFQEVTNGVLDQAFVTTIDQVGLVTPWENKPVVIEDIIPPSLLSHAVVRYLKDRWGTTAKPKDIEKLLQDTAAGTTGANRLVQAVKSQLGADATDITDEELKSQVNESFVDTLIDGDSLGDDEATKQFAENVRLTCKKFQELIDEAESRSQRDSLHKCIKLSVASFQKSHHKGATRADMERCLAALERECSGFTKEARTSRENLSELGEVLEKEVATARDNVDIEKWNIRLKKFSECPWKRPKNGWAREV